MFNQVSTAPVVVGFHSRVGGGKDTAALCLSRIIKDKYDGSFTQAAYADPGREYLLEILRIYGITAAHFVDRELKDRVFEPLGRTPRDLLKDFLSGWGREMVIDTLWADTMNAKISAFTQCCADHIYKVHGPNIMAVTDVRKPNEAQGILDRGGVIVEIKNSFAEERTSTKDLRYGTEDRLPDNLVTYTIDNNYNPEQDDPAESLVRFSKTLNELLKKIFAEGVDKETAF